jgi:hypothetical protein
MYAIDDATGELSPLQESAYGSESELQELIARYPQILNGADSDGGRSYALVRREHGIADGLGAGDRWSVDHVFVDQDSVPSFVEVKRATDTRIRREVVGQMLDYAANAVEYFAEGRLRASFETRCRESGDDPARVIEDIVASDDFDLDAYWAEVDANLRRGRIRLVFCSDRMPNELKRIAEFLNAQTLETEIVALEIAQHTTPAGLRVLAPRIFGETLQTPKRASTSQVRRTWTIGEYLELVDETGPAGFRAVLEEMLVHWQERGRRITFGSGAKLTALYAAVDHGKENFWMMAIYPDCVEIAFRWLKIRRPFDKLALREELRTRLNRIEGIELAADRIGKYPRFPSEVLLDSVRRAQFLEIEDWFEATARATPIELTGAPVTAEEDLAA